jgi:uncharacterized protein YbcV (DUF1398 family)
MKNHLFNIHHKIKLQLDAICQEAGDMNVEEFVEVYKYLQTNNESIDDKEIILMQSKRINELTISIEHLETFELDNIELKNANKLAHERIKELLEFDQNLNKAGVYRFTKDLEDTIVHLKVRNKELEEKIQRWLC